MAPWDIWIAASGEFEPAEGIRYRADFRKRNDEKFIYTPPQFRSTFFATVTLRPPTRGQQQQRLAGGKDALSRLCMAPAAPRACPARRSAQVSRTRYPDGCQPPGDPTTDAALAYEAGESTKCVTGRGLLMRLAQAVAS